MMDSFEAFSLALPLVDLLMIPGPVISLLLFAELLHDKSYSAFTQAFTSPGAAVIVTSRAMVYKYHKVDNQFTAITTCTCTINSQ